MIGELLKKFRTDKGMTQQQLADLVNLSQQSIDHYENNRSKPSLDTIKMFAETFNTSVDYLLGRSNDPSPSPKSTIDEEWPGVANILRRNGKKLTPADKKRIEKIIKAAVEDTDE